jgi:hypothetical protein
MGNIDRRILYLIAIIVMALPQFVNIPLPVAPNVNSDNFYKTVEAVDQSKGGNLILLSANFSPDTRGESLPQCRAIIRHLLTSGKKFAIFTFNASTAAGQEMANNAAMEIARELEKKKGIKREYGKDWVNLGLKPSTLPILQSLSRNVPGFFRTDVRGTPIEQIPVMRGIKTAEDFGAVIDVSPSATYLMIIAAITGKYNRPFLLAPTSVMVPDTYPFLKSGQMKGELRGVLGAAEYEAKLNHQGLGTRYMTSIAALDGYIILLIILGDIETVRSRRREKENAR